jgi:hypothetical protein
MAGTTGAPATAASSSQPPSFGILSSLRINARVTNNVTTLNGTSGAIELHSTHDLTQCEWCTPECEATNGVAASVDDETITETIAPGTNWNVRIIVGNNLAA